ncbi:MAG: molybdate ABC transporter substrate-binding protein [Bordetella sp.]|nr:MAG: molybdate ABC transporter substrate-binding protein [Bordetella sp.]
MILFSIFSSCFEINLEIANDKNENIIVSIASSLSIPFQELIQNYESEFSQSKIILNSGASNTLFYQIKYGAPVSILISADQNIIKKLTQINIKIDSNSWKELVKNELVLITPTTREIQINSLNDLKSENIKRIAYGNPNLAPVGSYTKEILIANDIWTLVESKGIPTQTAKQCLDYVSRGEVDAGFVFLTDALSVINDVKIKLNLPTVSSIIYTGILIPQKNVINEKAKHFFSYMQSLISQEIFRKYGFQIIY